MHEHGLIPCNGSARSQCEVVDNLDNNLSYWRRITEPDPFGFVKKYLDYKESLNKITRVLETPNYA